MGLKDSQEETRKQYFEELKSDILERLPESFVEEHKKWKHVMREINMLIFILDDSKSEDDETECDFKEYKYDDFCRVVMKIYKRFFDENRVKLDSLFIVEKEYKEIESSSKNDKEIDEKTQRLIRMKINQYIYLPLEQFLIKESVKDRAPEKLLDKIEKTIKTDSDELDNGLHK